MSCNTPLYVVLEMAILLCLEDLGMTTPVHTLFLFVLFAEALTGYCYDFGCYFQ